MTWDGALRKSTMEFQHRSYNLLTCNCHSFVANNLNRLGFQASGWNVVNVAALILLKGRWVSKAAMVRSYLPFVIVFCLGVTFGGGTFLTFLAFFTFLLVGWFVLGTYCVRNLVQLQFLFSTCDRCMRIFQMGLGIYFFEFLTFILDQQVVLHYSNVSMFLRIQFYFHIFL